MNPDSFPTARILFLLTAFSLPVVGLVAADEAGAPAIEATVQFERDGTRLTDAGLDALKEVAGKIAQAGKDAVFAIEGHASDLGTDEVNERVSRQRAEWVRDHLVKEYSIDAGRLEVLAAGEKRPKEAVAPGDSADERNRKRALNRRVEIRALPAEDAMAKTRGLPTDSNQAGKNMTEKATKPDMPVDPAKDTAKPDEKRGYVHAANRTAFDLFRALSNAAPKENVLLSPHSIGQAMTMTYLGAGGETEADMAKVLHLAGQDGGEIAEANRRLTAAVNEIGGGESTLDIANAFAITSKETKLRPEYEEILKGAFGADVIPGADLEKINAWVSDRTQGKIPELLKELNEDSRLVLLNALYFQADWKHPFPAGKTEAAPFRNAAGAEVEVDMMAQGLTVPVFRTEKWRGLALPYQDERLALVAVLPNEASADEILSAGLSPEDWDGILSGLAAEGNASGEKSPVGYSTGKVTIRMPKLKLEESASLVEPFREMGMKEPFGEKSNFSRMSEEPFSISQIRHAVTLELDEKGTEAAAATAVELKSRGMGPVPEAFVFDRPFLVAVVDPETGSILILGRVSNLR